MRYWSYVDPGPNGEDIKHTLSEGEIIRTYFKWWSAQMRKVGKAHLISRKACIEDWVVVNWAQLEGDPHVVV